MSQPQEKDYPIQDDIWPSRRWNKEMTDYIDLSGHEEQPVNINNPNKPKTMTKFKVLDIHKHGTFNSAILKMIAKHNGGQCPMSIPDLLSFGQIQQSLINASNLVIERRDGDENTFDVSEDGGKTFTLTIEEIEIHELAEVQ